MKILSINSARSIWLVNTRFLNPHGQYIAPMLAALAERYHFSKVPHLASITAQPLDLKFEAGSFVSSTGTTIFVNLSIHDDGLIAETRTSTDESDRFLDDALAWYSATYEMPHYSELGIQKLYTNEVIVDIDLSTTIFSDRFSQFVRRLNKGITNNPGISMELTALHFGPDPEKTKKLAPFRLERLAGAPFERNEYYSAAPVSTNEHLELLGALEEAAGARS